MSDNFAVPLIVFPHNNCFHLFPATLCVYKVCVFFILWHFLSSSMSQIQQLLHINFDGQARFWIYFTFLLFCVLLLFVSSEWVVLISTSMFSLRVTFCNYFSLTIFLLKLTERDFFKKPFINELELYVSLAFGFRSKFSRDMFLFPICLLLKLEGHCKEHFSHFLHSSQLTGIWSVM